MKKLILLVLVVFLSNWICPLVDTLAIRIVLTRPLLRPKGSHQTADLNPKKLYIMVRLNGMKQEKKK